MNQEQQLSQQEQPKIPKMEEMILIGKATKQEVTLNWGVIRRALDVLLKLAPQELRSPEDFLDTVYEQKKALRELYTAELDAGFKEVVSTIERIARPVECVECFADPDTCPYMPINQESIAEIIGGEDCLKRRKEYADKYAQQTGGDIITDRDRSNQTEAVSQEDGRDKVSGVQEYPEG